MTEAKFDVTELPEDVQEHIARLQAQLDEYSQREAENNDKMARLQSEQEGKNKSLKERLKSEGDLKSLVSEQELEISNLKETAAEKAKLDKLMREMVKSRAADAPEDIQAMLKDMTPEVALKHLDTILPARGVPNDMPETGGRYPTGQSNQRLPRLTAEQARVAHHMGIAREDYAKAVIEVKAMNDRMREMEAFNV